MEPRFVLGSPPRKRRTAEATWCTVTASRDGAMTRIAVVLSTHYNLPQTFHSSDFLLIFLQRWLAVPNKIQYLER